MTFDFLILGNGAIGMFAAMKIKQAFPNRNVGIIGDVSRENGASVAAGAMCNVFAEVESPFSEAHSQLMDLSLWYGIAGRKGWLDLMAVHTEFDKVKTANDTLVFLKEDASDFEIANFKASNEIAESNEVSQGIDTILLSQLFESASKPPLEAFKIAGEFAIDSRLLFSLLSKKCFDLGIVFLDANIVGVDLINSEVKTQNSGFRFDKLIIALGSNSSRYLPNGIMPNLVQGVGTAFEISEKGIAGPLAKKNFVIRTVNRGGAQCGFHFVPRNKGYYLGAGNYIMSPGKSDHRLETLRYLFDTFEREVCGSEISYRLEGNLVKGHRPRAIDGFPLIGHLANYQNVFIASGTNRAGFTWAPKIADQVLVWCQGEQFDSPFIALTSPNRKAIDFGTEEQALNYYTESRIAAALEHEKIDRTKVSLELERHRILDYARSLLAEVRQVNGVPESVPHPDHWAVIMEQESICNV